MENQKYPLKLKSCPYNLSINMFSENAWLCDLQSNLYDRIEERSLKFPLVGILMWVN